VLIEHGLDEAVVEKLVNAGIGTVERLGSKTPEELEAIPDIDEETITQIQTAIVSFYGQYEQTEAEYAEDAAANPGHDLTSRDVVTGVLEHDLARHESAPTTESGDVEVIDLGQVEGLSAAPSSLEPPTEEEVEQTAENAESANIKVTE
jgi:N utilization substance protein A